MAYFSTRWIKLQQECYLIEACLTQGLTALRQADLSKKGLFYSAFFQLAIGLERLMKIILIIEHMADNKLETPSLQTMKSFQHNLSKLYGKVREIPIEATPHPFDEIPEDGIAYEILAFLDAFAASTRYFNLDSLTSQPKGIDPLNVWSDIVYKVANTNVTEAKRSKIHGWSKFFGEHVEPGLVSVIGHGMDGQPLDMESMMAWSQLNQAAAPYTIWYVFQVIRAIREVLLEVHLKAMAVDKNVATGESNIPYMPEFLTFAWWERSDVLRKRRWP
jgi:hypothetical protein